MNSDETIVLDLSSLLVKKTTRRTLAPQHDRDTNELYPSTVIGAGEVHRERCHLNVGIVTAIVFMPYHHGLQIHRVIAILYCIKG